MQCPALRVGHDLIAMPTLTVSFCTFKRADRLEKLVAALRAQSCPVPFEILAINNNSPDNTLEVLAHLQRQSGAPLRIVTETAPGIVPARNRALEEALDRDILVFIDDDELPQPGLLETAYDAIANEGADCVGGRIEIDFSPHGRPTWLDDEVAGFLGRLNHGNNSIWVIDERTPVWSGNIAYAMPFFRERPSLRFDQRFNRADEGIGGGEDAAMLGALLALGAKIRYRSDMTVHHAIDSWKLKRRYFVRLHYKAGIRFGQFSLPDFKKTIMGIPPFLISQFFAQCMKTLHLFLARKQGQVRQLMNAAHSLGSIMGYRKRIAH